MNNDTLAKLNGLLDTGKEKFSFTVVEGYVSCPLCEEAIMPEEHHECKKGTSR